MARSSELGRRPLAVTLMDTPLVVFRGAGGKPAVVLDRCAHRNYPLSLGRVTGDGLLQCGYHGWSFDGGGQCLRVPGLRQVRTQATWHVPSHATVEQDGFVWAWGEPDAEPTRAPFALPVVDGRGAGETVFRCDLDATLRASLENELDVPHTAFLHRGLFRGGPPRTITAVRRPIEGGVEVQYLGEPVGMGPIRLPADSGRTFDHWDRFLLPSIAQIEYAVEGWFRIVNTIVQLPLGPFRTRAWFVVRFSSPLPAPLVRTVVHQQGRRILRQDADALARQTGRARDFGGERYASTQLDLLGTSIWRLLRQAERAEQPDGDDAAARDRQRTRSRLRGLSRRGRARRGATARRLVRFRSAHPRPGVRSPGVPPGVACGDHRRAGRGRVRRARGGPASTPWSPTRWATRSSPAGISVAARGRRSKPSSPRSSDRLLRPAPSSSARSTVWRRPERQGSPAILLGVEGADALGADVDRVDAWHERGVRMVVVVHLGDNLLGTTSLPWQRYAGPLPVRRRTEPRLSALGARVVERMQQLGVLVDVAHCDRPTLLAITGIATAPVVSSHAGARALQDFPRYLTDPELAAIAATGGVVGLWPFRTRHTGVRDLAELVAHARHIADTIGPEHLALGTDMNGVPGVMAGYRGETDLPKVTYALLDGRFDVAQVSGIIGGNAVALPSGPRRPPRRGERPPYPVHRRRRIGDTHRLPHVPARYRVAAKLEGLDDDAVRLFLGSAVGHQPGRPGAAPHVRRSDCGSRDRRRPQAEPGQTVDAGRPLRLAGRPGVRTGRCAARDHRRRGR